MNRHLQTFFLFLGLAFVASLVMSSSPVVAQEANDSPQIELEFDSPPEDPGQEDLDEAAVLRIDSDSARELQAVERLLQSAIKKGLTGENSAFAKKMLGSVLLQKSQQLIASMTRGRAARPLQIRDEALRTLNSAVKHDPQLVEAYLLIARLNMPPLPGGDQQAVIDATSKAIEILADNPAERSTALVLRALTWGPADEEKKIADLDQAIKDNSKNLDALKARAEVRLAGDDIAGAIADMESILAEDPTNQDVAQAIVGQLIELDRFDDALKLLSKALEAKPSEGLYRLRGILYRMDRNEEKAVADFNKALAMQPQDPITLLQRAEASLSLQRIQAAKDDLRAAERIDSRVAMLDQAILVRSMIAYSEGRMADAINDVKTLVTRDPSNIDRQMHLASLYIEDDRPRKAIEILAAILDRDPNNIRALRRRGDALLSVGDHKKAIEDYERALKAAEGEEENYDDVPGLMNNLAWVLATSPNDDVRDGKRAVELGEKAVDLTEEKLAHVLSTLAAAYAEVGDFEKAVEWSTKAVELGKEKEHDQIEQLEGELESYRAKKPWREKQDTEENDVPILSPDDLIDT